MSIGAHTTRLTEPLVSGWESMYRLIRQVGLLPFFENPIPGFSLEEHTDAEHWFTDESLTGSISGAERRPFRLLPFTGS